MRISEREKEHILVTVRRFDAEARVILFGSRADDAKRGGDIDLLILSRAIGGTEKRRIRGMLCDALGDQRIDIMVAADARDPIVRIAQETGVSLQ
jgi:uncharacterized protein